jgi:radical SAM protein with 4Fe4S-binding SPASM domain
MTEYKISMAQIDPNGTCNSRCWFCPVAYVPNPEKGRKTMPIELFDSLIRQLTEGKGRFVADSFNGIYTAHYNEVLLYAYFDEMLEVLRRYHLGTLILSNGTPLSKKRTDTIKKYQDVVRGVCLNIPAAEPESWSRFTGISKAVFPHLIENIRYFHEQLPHYVESKAFSIQMNGVNRHSLSEGGGWLDMLGSAPALDLDPETGDLHRNYLLFKEMFPDTQVFEMPSLLDRAGYLDTHNIITNKRGIERYLKKDNARVVGCGNGREVGGRPNGWLHVNANGDLFICCSDYDFDTVFGNVNESTLEQAWMSDSHKQMIERSYDTICRTCASAIWGKCKRSRLLRKRLLGDWCESVRKAA